MTREEAKEMLPIIQAWADGKIIQVREKGRWVELCIDDFNRSPDMYRIKPEPKYRPFKSQEECWQEMLNHQPFGWVKAPNGELFCIDSVFDEGITYRYASYRFEEYFIGNYSFADGTPFGIKED